MAGPNPGPSLDDLLRETGAARKALHDLIERVRGDRAAWRGELAGLSRRSRLTRAQRQHLLFHPPRRSRPF